MEQLKKLKENIVVMAALLAGCLYLWLWGIPGQIPEAVAAKGQSFTPRTFPYLCAAVICFCAAVSLVRSALQYVRLRREFTAPPAQPITAARPLPELLMPFLIYAILILYYLLFDGIGFLWSTILIPPVILWVLRCRKWYFYLATYLFAGTMYAIFAWILHVNLP